MQTLLAWMENPVPVDKMDAWLKSRCIGPKGVVKHPKMVEKGVLKAREGAIMQSGGISHESMVLAGGSVLAVTAVLMRRRKGRRVLRPPPHR